VAITALPGGDDEEGGIVAEINITPLTDIFLVLLIIFMVTTTVVEEEGKNIELPTATESEETPKGVTVAVELDGSMYINEKLVPAGSLFAMLEQTIEESEQKIVILKGDRRVLLGQAVNILDTAQQAGAKGIAIQTEQPIEEEEGG
jgi:biopolymer transport protein ExbD